MEGPRLYNDLASLWLAFSPPEEYTEEVASFVRRFSRHGVPDGGTVLHLGSGGGSIDFLLKRHYRVTGVDLSEPMLAVSRALNPEVEYLDGDIRDVRLGRTFDAVLLHDAISYMTSVAELEAAYRTAAAHLRPGGIMLALPEELKGRRADEEVSAVTRSVGHRTVTFIETSYDPDPSDTTFEVVYLFMIREDDSLRVEVDRHVNGMFELDQFLRAVRKAGFDAVAEPWELSEWEPGREMPLIRAVKR